MGDDYDDYGDDSGDSGSQDFDTLADAIDSGFDLDATINAMGLDLDADALEELEDLGKTLDLQADTVAASSIDSADEAGTEDWGGLEVEHAGTP